MLISVYDHVEHVGIDPVECPLVSLSLRFAKSTRQCIYFFNRNWMLLTSRLALLGFPSTYSRLKKVFRTLLMANWEDRTSETFHLHLGNYSWSGTLLHPPFLGKYPQWGCCVAWVCVTSPETASSVGASSLTFSPALGVLSPPNFSLSPRYGHYCFTLHLI